MPFLPLQGESLDLKSGRFRSQKTGRYTRRVDLEVIVTSIKSIFTSVQNIDQSTTVLAEKSELIRDDIKQLVQLSTGTAPQPEPKSKPDLGAARANVAATVKKAGFNALGLAGLILLLKNEKVMAIVKGFFTGFLKSLGVSEETIEMLGTAAKVLTKMFEIYLAYKLFKNISEAFTAMKNLGMAMGLLSEKNAAAGAELSAKEAKLAAKEKAGDLRDNKKMNKMKRRLKKTKLNLKKVGGFFSNSQRRNKVTKRFFNNRIKDMSKQLQKLGKVAKRFKSFLKLVFTGLKGIRKAVSIAKLAMAIPTLGISLLIGIVLDAALGTAIDYFSAKQMDDKSPGLAEIAGFFGKNLVETITLGLVSGDKIGEIVTNLARKFFGWFDKALSFFGFGGKKGEAKQTKTEKKPLEETMKPAQIDALVRGFKKGIIDKQLFDKEWSNNAQISMLGPTVMKNTKLRDKVWTEYSKKNLVTKKPMAAASTANPPPAPAGTSTGSKSSGSAGSSSSAPAAAPSLSTSTSPSNSDANTPKPGVASKSADLMSTAQMESAPKEMSVASLAENVALDKKSEEQAKSSAGDIIMNNINTTNVIGASQAPIPKKPSSTIFSDTVGF